MPYTRRFNELIVDKINCQFKNQNYNNQTKKNVNLPIISIYHYLYN